MLRTCLGGLWLSLCASSALAGELPAGKMQGSCRFESYGVVSCSDYEGPYKGAALQKSCEDARGTWSASPCETKGRAGTCTKTEGAPENLNHTRMYAPYTPESAKRICEKNLHGSFSAD